MANEPENRARWLPDPTGRHQYRFWNGSSWSDDVSNNGTTGKDRSEILRWRVRLSRQPAHLR
jgi:Protein of unknown function (DUF2510)